ncbi:MAG: hypothetical protein HY275_15430 [Gemmatimonadetes bacterium]|nr:hypothetical protein [Gemmatimonadota bacterium]
MRSLAPFAHPPSSSPLAGAPAGRWRIAARFAILAGVAIAVTLVLRLAPLSPSLAGVPWGLAWWLVAAVGLALLADATAGRRARREASAEERELRFRLARRLDDPAERLHFDVVRATELVSGDHVLVVEGDVVPAPLVAVAGSAQVTAAEGAPFTCAASAARSRASGGDRIATGWLVGRVVAPADSAHTRRLSLHRS